MSIEKGVHDSYHLDVARPLGGLSSRPDELIDNLHNIDDSEKRLVAQYLHTDFLLQGGYIEEDSIGSDGLYWDEYSQSSEYFLVGNGSRLAACRCISPVNSSEGVSWLPTLKHFDVEYDLNHIGIDIRELAPDEVIEVSALISPLGEVGDRENRSPEAAHLLCTTVLRHSLDIGHRAWVMNIQESLRRSLDIFLGGKQVHRIGVPMNYYRPDAVPCLVEPEKAVQGMLSSGSAMKEYRLNCLRSSMNGVSERHLSDSTIQLLHESGIDTSSSDIDAYQWA